MNAPPAEIRTDPDGGSSVVWRRDFPDTVEDVWSAITDSERLGRWIGTWSGTPAVGGTVAFTMTGEVDAGGEVGAPVDVTIVACDPPHHLAVDLPEDGADRAWHLDLTVSPTDAGAVLVFAQRLVDGVRRSDVEAGWTWYLDRLAASLRGAPMPDWAAYTG